MVVQDEGVLDSVMLEKFRQLTPRKPCKINGLKWCGLKDGTWDSAWSASARILSFADGSFIEFKTYKQERQSHAGPQRHWILFDEEPPRDIHEENLARQTTLRVNVGYTMTPLNYSNWIYRMLHQKSATDKRVCLVTASVYDNKYAPPETIKFLEETYTDPAERAARIYGTPTYMEGLVYKGYGDHNLIDPWDIPERDVEYSVVIDPHEDKPTAWNMFAEDKDGRLYVLEEGDVEGDVEYICDSIFAQLGGRKISLWLCDPSARRRAIIRGKPDRMIDEFRRRIPRLIEANNSVDVGISRVRSAVQALPNAVRPKIMVSKNCQVTHHQMKNYSWKAPLKSGEDRTKPMVAMRQNDHPDCIRYRKMHQPIYGGVELESFGIGVYAN